MYGDMKKLKPCSYTPTQCKRKKRKGRRGVGLTGVRFGVVEIIGGLVERGVSRVGGRRYVMVDLNW